MPVVSVTSSSNSGYQTANTGTSWSHSVSGTNTFVVVMVSVFDLFDDVGFLTVTYDSEEPNFSEFYNAGDEGDSPVYHYVAEFLSPDSGTHNVSVSLPASCDWVGHAISFKDVQFDGDGPHGNGSSSTIEGSGGTASTTVDVVDSSCIMIGFLTTEDTDGITRDTGMVDRGEVTGSLGTSAVTTEGTFSGSVESPNAVGTAWAGNGTGKEWVLSAFYLVSDPDPPPTFKAAWAKNSNQIIQAIPA